MKNININKGGNDEFKTKPLNKLLGEKLKSIRESKKQTLEEFSLSLNEDRQTYYNYEIGSRQLPYFKLHKYAEILKLNYLDILSLLNFNNTDIFQRKPSIPSILDLSVFADTLIDKSKYKQLPVYAYAGAGKFIDLTEIEPIDTILIPKEYANSGSLAVVKVVGKSMEPIIHEGAYIGVDKDNRNFISGNIYAVYLPFEGAVIKKVFTDIKNVILKSENKEFPDIVIPLKNIDKDNFIIGTVKWVLQKF
jgi:SOS-response transcriptional repressor LexA